MGEGVFNEESDGPILTRAFEKALKNHGFNKPKEKFTIHYLFV